MVAEELQKNKMQLLSEGAWIFIGKIISFSAILAMVRLLTTHMDAIEYGQLALALTLCNLTTQLIMGPLGQGVGRYFVVAKHDGGYDGFIDACKGLLKNAGSILIGIGISIAFFAAIYGRFDYAFLGISIFIFSYLTGLNDISNSFQNLARNRMISVRNAALELLLRLPLVWIIIIAFGPSPEMVIVGYLLSSAFVAALQKIDFPKLAPSEAKSRQDEGDWRNDILQIAIPASFWGLFIWLQQSSDRWFLQFFGGSQEVGQYAVIYQLGYMPIVTIMGLAVTLFVPLLYRNKRPNSMMIAMLLLFTFTINFFAMSIFWLAGESLMTMLVGNEFRSLVKFMPHMILAGGLYSAGDILCIALMSAIRTREILIIKIGASIIGIIANFCGAYFYGFIGVVYGAVIFGLAYFIFFLIEYFRLIKHNKVV